MNSNMIYIVYLLYIKCENDIPIYDNGNISKEVIHE
jgi:hypothetical protein